MGADKDFREIKIMEERKEKEIEYYDERAKESLENPKKAKKGDFEGFRADLLSSFRFCYQWIEKNARGKNFLDYGCGNGIHSIFPAKAGAKVVAIDLSEPSLILARQRAKKEGVEGIIQFIKMDCENLEFENNCFDVVFDGGTFSSLDINKALPEIARVLNPEGKLIGIETFGHNPFANLKRKINKLRKSRTGWAVEHIFSRKDLETAEKYFRKIEVNYFHIVSWIVFPFINLPGAIIILRILEKADAILAKIPGIRQWAFKVVFIFSEPKK